MRKIIVYNVISLDGYHTGPGNEVSVMFPMMGKVFDSYNAELLRTADLHLVGRVDSVLFQQRVLLELTDLVANAQRRFAHAFLRPPLERVVDGVPRGGQVPSDGSDRPALRM